MFWHNFKYSLKALLKNKGLIFWTFAFPIILGFFFNLAFSDIENSEKLDIIPIAVVNSENADMAYFKSAIDNLSVEGSEEQLFDTKYMNLEDAKKALEEEEIKGYIELEKLAKITVKSSGIDETIIKAVVDEISEYNTVIENVTKNAMSQGKTIEEVGKIVENSLDDMKNVKANIVDKSNVNMSYTMIEYYTLIAMTCLYGGTISMVVILNVLSNVSSRGKRVSISKAKKSTLIMSGLLSSFIVELMGLVLLYLFMIFVIKVDFGAYLGAVVLLSLIGSLAGLTLGVAVGTLAKGTENTKTGILISLTMAGCFFSGMMGITMKYIVDANVPILNMINPANMITDGFYALYYYGVGEKFYIDIISLLVFSLIMIVLSIRSLRRERYDSI